VARASGNARTPRPRQATTSSRSRARSGAPAQSRELRARGKQTLRKLLDAGAEVFATRGYHAARVDDIVKLARASHGTFYLYFANKEDLFRALVAEVADETQALAESLGPLSSGPDGRRELEEWIAEYSALYERHGPVIRAWTEAEIGNREFGRLGNEVRARFTGALAERIEEVAPPDLDPETAAIALVAMLERLNYYAITRQVKLSRADIVETLTRVAHVAIFGAA
jgi:AcrR family transcriptional regulator